MVADPMGAVFISYASEDSEAAARIAESLKAVGIEVWLDQSKLRGGEVWDHAITEQIHRCRLFMPLISADTEARAAGRAYLSRLPIDEVTDILDRSSLRPLTPNTVTDRARILDLVGEAREMGYARADQECYRGDLTLGAPVIGQHGRPVAAVHISGPTSRWTLQELVARWAPLLMETARAASSRMADRIAMTGST
jgi:hypothetical protein